MLSRQQVADRVREAAAALQELTQENAALKAQKDELLQKVASLEEAINSKKEEETPPALQKEADEGFHFRSGNGFGSSADDIPGMGSDLTPEQRLDMILNGESPSDFE